MIYWCHVIGTFLVRLVPVRACYALVSFFAPVGLLLFRDHYRRAEENLKRVLGPGRAPGEYRRLARNVFRNYAKYVVDLLRLPSVNFADLERKLVISGWEHIEQARRAGRGLVVVSGHIGSFDLGAAWLAAQGLPVNLIVETLEPARWNERVQRLRQTTGARTLPIETGVRQMVRALRQREVLAVLIDRPLAQRGVPVSFFDAPTRVPTGPAALALRTGAALLAVGVVRVGDRFGVHISPPLETGLSADADAAVEALTQRVMHWLEGLIRTYPDQWFMFREFWPQAAG